MSSPISLCHQKAATHTGKISPYQEIWWLLVTQGAPRPMLIIAGKEDSIFRIEGVYQAYEKLEAIYDAFGAKDNLELDVGEEGHRYYAARVWDFFAQHGQ